MGLARRLVVGFGTIMALLVVLLAVQALTTHRPPMDQQEPGVAEETPVRPPDGTPTPPEASPSPRRPVQAAAGLHHTPEEVEIWRERAESGPYRMPGDAGENTPGDWERIAENAEEFLEEPSESRWEGPDGDGCVEPEDDGPPTLEASQLRDAAFYYLVKQEPEYRDAVKDELLEQASEPDLDFSDTDRWCPGELNDLPPAFQTTHWLTKLLFAYDYLGEDAFNEDEHEDLQEWFQNAAVFFQKDIESSLDDNFIDRESGDYAISEARREDPDCDGRIAYYGSEPVCAIARYYNNRRAAQMRFVALVGLHQGNAELQDSARRFVHEFLAYSFYPDGYFGEFERWEERLPDLGWAYANNAVGAVVTIADHFARAGDPSMYEYTTSAGAQGTEGGPKSLRSAIHALGKYVDGTYERYATDDEDDVGDDDYLINANHEPSDWYSLHDLALMPSNVYYQDDYIRKMYTRTGAGMPAYPEEPASNGDHEIWKGESGIYPGVLFMFGGMEGAVWPYPSVSGEEDAY